MEMTLNSLDIMIRSFFEHGSDNLRNEIDGMTWEVRNHEAKCDELRRALERQALSSSVLRPHSDVVFMLLESVDKVPNRAEAVADFLFVTRLDTPSAYHNDILQIMRLNIKCVASLSMALVKLFDNYQLALNQARTVEMTEAAVDKMEIHLMRRIFKSTLPVGEKLLLREFVQYICGIADRAEDASDIVEILALKLLE